MKSFILLPLVILFIGVSTVRAVDPEPEPEPEVITGWELLLPDEKIFDLEVPPIEINYAFAGEFAHAATAEIRSLASGLAAGEGGPNNPEGAKRIYDYVRNRIEYTHYFGCKKGAQLTLLEGSGGDFDQCALLVALLRAAGYTANYELGMVSLPYTNAVNNRDIQHWLRLDVPGGNLTTVSNYLTDLNWVRNYPILDTDNLANGYPLVWGDQNLNFQWPRTWVVLTIGGTNYYLDPAFKVSERVNGINFATISGVSKSELLAVAGGVTNGALSVRNLNETNLSATLTTYTTNLLAHLRSNFPNASPLDIIGGWRIVPTTTASLPTSRPFNVITNVLFGNSNFLVLAWTNIPDKYFYTLQIRTHNGVVYTGIDKTYPYAELAGQRLCLTTNGAAPQQMRLWLDDVLQASETNYSSATLYVQLYATSPKGRWNYGGDYGLANIWPPMAEEKIYRRSAPGYALIYGFEPSGDLLRQRQEKLSEYTRLGYTNGSREVLTETLNVIGQSWLFQTALCDRLLAVQKNLLVNNHNRVGRVGQESAYYIDVSLQRGSSVSANGSSAAERQSEKDTFDTSSYFDSAMEHGVLEQMQGGNAISTIKVLHLANSTNTIFRATNWASISGALSNYTLGPVTTPNTLLNLSNRLQNGSTLLLPSNGKMTLGIWQGPAYVDRREVSTNYSMGMLIGGLSGGYNTFLGTVSPTPLISHYSSTPVFFSPAPIILPPIRGADPVNMVDGSFTVEATDLTLGKADPQGLAFARHYSSAMRNLNSSALGYGWGHNYRIYASDQADVRAGLGLTTPAEMAPFLVATRAALEVYTNSNTAKEWAVVALIAKWGVDQLRSNAVSIVLGKDAVQFVRQPDGSFTPSAGLKMTLLRTNNLYALQERHGRTFLFDSSNRVSSIRDPFGKTNSFTYTNTTGNLIQVKDAWNRALTFSYAASNRLSSVTDSTGRTIALAVDTNLNLLAVADPEGKTNRFTYDTNHQITSVRDALNQLVTTNFFDETGKVTNQWTQGDPNKSWQLYFANDYSVEQDPAGGRRWFFFDERKRPTSIRDPLGNTNLLVYDGQDHVIQQISPLGETNRFQYDADQNLLWSLDPLGFGKTNYYDSQHRLIATTDARGNTSLFGYNAQHALTGTTNGAGVWMTFGYNSDGNVTNRTDSGGTTGYGYDTFGQLNSITHPGGFGSESFVNHPRGDVTNHTDARGFVTSFQYNLRRELTKTIAPTNLTTQVAYDAIGNVLSSTDARGNSSSNFWSATQKLLASTLPATPQGTPVTTNIYDNREWLVRTIENPASSVSASVHFTNDAAQRLIAVADPLLRVNKFGFDAVGRQLAATNAAQEVTRQTWNARGELLQTLTPQNTTIKHNYDAAGNQITLTNRNGKKWQFQFDGANRLTNTITPRGAETRVTFDSRGLVSAVREPSTETTTSFYDAKGRLTNLTDTVGTRWFAYDANDNLVSVTNVGQGLRVSQTFDAYNRMNSHTTVDGYLIQYRYDANGNLTNLIYPGNRVVAYAYDSLNRLTNVTDWANRQTAIEYDLANRVKKITRPNATVRTMDYDAADQVTNIWERTGSGLPIAYFKFNWNTAGRAEWEFAAPLPHAYTPPTRTMTYDDDNRFATFNGNNVVHDADGNMTSGPLTNATFASYSYDARNRLLAVGGLDYGYDPAGNRTAITNGASVTRFVVNPNVALSQTLMRVRSGVTNFYIYGLGLLYEITETATSTNTATYHFDIRGSTVAMTDGSGNLTDRIEYSPYATTTYRAGTNDTPFLYNGRYGVQTDANGLLHMRARYYNPFICRFLNADPSGFEGGLNFYAYADGDPVSMMDPFGLGAIGTGGQSWISQALAGTALGDWVNGFNRGLDYWSQGIDLNYYTYSGSHAYLEGINSGYRAVPNAIEIVSTFALAGIGGGPGRAITGGGSRNAGAAGANSLVHMSESAGAIRASGKLGLPSNNYAGPASNAGFSGWALTRRTGLNPNGNYSPVSIPRSGEAAFSKVVPIGPVTAWQRWTGQRYTAKGVLDLSTGAFTRSGLNWNQITWYGIDVGIDAGLIGGAVYYGTQSR